MSLVPFAFVDTAVTYQVPAAMPLIVTCSVVPALPE
jgi:hypothetical protein